jgi:hypothetical protein
MAKRIALLSFALLVAVQSTPASAAGFLPAVLDTAKFAVEGMQRFAVFSLPGQEASPLTRMQLVSAIVSELYASVSERVCYDTLDPVPPTPFVYLFTDVRSDALQARELCIAMVVGLVQGYGDGSFRPDAPINFAEAAKVLAKTFDLHTSDGALPWYRPYLEGLARAGVIPVALQSPEQIPTAAQVQEMLEKLVQRTPLGA